MSLRSATLLVLGFLMPNGVIAENLSSLCDANWRNTAQEEQISAEISRLISEEQTGPICDNQSTALHFVTNADQVVSLLAGGANADQANADGVSPMIAAASWGRADVIRELALAGADPDQPSIYGETPLHIAVQSIEPGAVGALLDAGARVGVWSNEGMTPLDLAIRYSQPEIVDMFRSHLETHRKIDFGFGTIELPGSSDWYEPQSDPRTGRIAASKLVERRHSIVAMLGISTDFPNETAYLLKSQPEKLLNFRIPEIRQQLDDGRFPIKEFRQFDWGFKETVCRGYELAANDLAAHNDSGELYEFRAIGLACIVPKYPAYLELDYSERWDPAQTEYEHFKQEAWDFFDSFVVE